MRRATLFKTSVTLLLFVIVTASLAGSQFIRADKGGVIPIAEGAKLTIPAGALSADSWVEATYEPANSQLTFVFSVDNHTGDFGEPVILQVPYSIYRDAADTTLHSNTGTIDPIGGGDGKPLVYELEHFSLYYFERR